MKRYLTLIAMALAGVAVSLSAAPMAGLRGRVVDEAGQGIADVKMDLEFLGESRVKITKSQTSDKKGGFVRMGIPDGKWKITFSKEGYKTYVMEIFLSLGGFSEAGDIVLKAAPAAAAAATAEPVAAVLPPTPEANQAGADYTKALEAARAGRVDEAEPILKDVVARFPDLANAHYNLAYVYQLKKDWKAAEAEYVRVTELEPAKATPTSPCPRCGSSMAGAPKPPRASWPRRPPSRRTRVPVRARHYLCERREGRRGGGRFP